MLYLIAVPLWICLVSSLGFFLVTDVVERLPNAIRFGFGYTIIVTFFFGGFFVAFWLLFTGFTNL